MRTLQDTTTRYAPLSAAALAAALRALPTWRCDGSRLVRTLRIGDVWGLLERVVAVEDELDHHAEVTLDGGAVTLTLWTHVRGTVTAADVELAQRLDDAAADLGTTSVTAVTS